MEAVLQLCLYSLVKHRCANKTSDSKLNCLRERIFLQYHTMVTNTL